MAGASFTQKSQLSRFVRPEIAVVRVKISRHSQHACPPPHGPHATPRTTTLAAHAVIRSGLIPPGTHQICFSNPH